MYKTIYIYMYLSSLSEYFAILTNKPLVVDQGFHFKRETKQMDTILTRNTKQKRNFSSDFGMAGKLRNIPIWNRSRTMQVDKCRAIQIGGKLGFGTFGHQGGVAVTAFGNMGGIRMVAFIRVGGG